MEFGRLPEIDSVDFSLPAEAPRSAAVLSKAGGAPCDLRLGLPSWSDPGLVARLGGESPTGVLRAHSAALPAHELNSTFYGYSEERLSRWAGAVPEGFLFCCKLPRSVSHDGMLEGVEDEMAAFVQASEALGERRGLSWFALPPFFGADRMGSLAAFLEEWADQLPLAVEVRDRSWFRDEGASAALFEMFESLGVTAVITDTAGRRDCAHMRLSSAKTLVRFVGNALHRSDFERLDRWAERLSRWAAAGLEQAYFFFHQQDEAQTLDLADHLDRRLAEAGHPVLGPWRARSGFRSPGAQLGLF
ncbi:MAG: DUF72 domain-containing protein [Planctomycetota bacterium]|nr:DUF72 domain-containing protein [Planctomycetota bacterium]MDG1984869.1 DUF72 domain-containing protein [Planctomycetota bacterium]